MGARRAGLAITTVVGLAAGFGLPSYWLWMTAPIAQRNEGRGQMVAEQQRHVQAEKAQSERYDLNDQQWRTALEEKSKETENLRGLLGQCEARVRDLEAARAEEDWLAAATVLATELRDIRRKIEKVKSMAIPIYWAGFQLPAARGLM
jgi:DNA repair exonuclease SbcCD ATPase subunit